MNKYEQTEKDIRNFYTSATCFYENFYICVSANGPIDEYYVLISRKTPHMVTTINTDGGTPVRSYFTKKPLKKKKIFPELTFTDF